VLSFWKKKTQGGVRGGGGGGWCEWSGSEVGDGGVTWYVSGWGVGVDVGGPIGDTGQGSGISKWLN